MICEAVGKPLSVEIEVVLCRGLPTNSDAEFGSMVTYKCLLFCIGRTESNKRNVKTSTKRPTWSPIRTNTRDRPVGSPWESEPHEKSLRAPFLMLLGLTLYKEWQKRLHNWHVFAESRSARMFGASSKPSDACPLDTVGIYNLSQLAQRGIAVYVLSFHMEPKIVSRGWR
jgi:hypothetical protein